MALRFDLLDLSPVAFVEDVAHRGDAPSDDQPNVRRGGVDDPNGRGVQT